MERLALLVGALTLFSVPARALEKEGASVEKVLARPLPEAPASAAGREVPTIGGGLVSALSPDWMRVPLNSAGGKMHLGKHSATAALYSDSPETAKAKRWDLLMRLKEGETYRIWPALQIFAADDKEFPPVPAAPVGVAGPTLPVAAGAGDKLYARPSGGPAKGVYSARLRKADGTEECLGPIVWWGRSYDEAVEAACPGAVSLGVALEGDPLAVAAKEVQEREEDCTYAGYCYGWAWSVSKGERVYGYQWQTDCEGKRKVSYERRVYQYGSGARRGDEFVVKSASCQ